MLFLGRSISRSTIEIVVDKMYKASYVLICFTSVFVTGNIGFISRIQRVEMNSSKRDQTSTAKITAANESIKSENKTGNEVPYLHMKEYKGDNFSHILGFGDPNHFQSKLQSISFFRIEDVIRAKEPLDAVSKQKNILQEF